MAPPWCRGGGRTTRSTGRCGRASRLAAVQPGHQVVQCLGRAPGADQREDSARIPQTATQMPGPHSRPRYGRPRTAVRSLARPQQNGQHGVEEHAPGPPPNGVAPPWKIPPAPPRTTTRRGPRRWRGRSAASSSASRRSRRRSGTGWGEGRVGQYGWWSTIDPFQVIVWATQPGFPAGHPVEHPAEPIGPGGEHERLDLEHGVEQPHRGQHSWNVRWRSLGLRALAGGASTAGGRRLYSCPDSASMSATVRPSSSLSLGRVVLPLVVAPAQAAGVRGRRGRAGPTRRCGVGRTRPSTSRTGRRDHEAPGSGEGAPRSR